MQKELLKHLHFLTEIRPFRNWMNLESLKIASDYIENEFTAYNLPVSEQEWNVGTNAYKNIIASYRPDLEKRLIVGAHYDVYTNQPGADDNASGVAGLLQLAKLTAKNKPELPYGIDFIGFCLEEPPHFGTKNMGSHVHAKSLKKNGSKIIGMICLDMIGYFSDAPNSQKYPMPELAQIFPSVGDYIAIIGLAEQNRFSTQIYDAMEARGVIDVQQVDFPDNDGLAGLSDHRNYWYYGYNAVMINNTAKFRNPNYHQVTDTVATLDLEKMCAVVESVYHALATPITESIPNKNVSEDPNSPIAPSNDRSGILRRFFMWLRNLIRKK